MYRWSAARTFAAVIGSETIAGGEINYADSIPLAFPAGRYSFDAWITNTQAPQYAGTVGFDIR